MHQMVQKNCLVACLFTKLANSKVWELPEGLFWHFLQKYSTSLAALKKEFGRFYDYGSDNAAILLSCPETILYDLSLLS